jgi:hypothetical protein
MSRAERVARNEALARVVNEQIGELNATGAQLPGFEVLCECGSSECMEPISVSRSEYEWVRVDPLRFIITPGHEIESVEDVIERHAGFEVVRKKPGVSAQVALKTDPRV